MKNIFNFVATMIASVGQEVSAALTPDQLAELSCVVVTEDLVSYDLRTLQKKDGTAYQSDGLSWNFCAYLEGTNTFAQIDAGKIPLTSPKATVKESSKIKNGVSITR